MNRKIGLRNRLFRPGKAGWFSNAVAASIWILGSMIAPAGATPSSPAAEADPEGASIPWEEVGAKAQSQYDGDGLSVETTEEGAVLHSVFQRLRGEATSEGLWLESTVEEAARDQDETHIS